MRLVRYESGGRSTAGALRGEHVIDLAPALGLPPESMLDLEDVIAQWAVVGRDLADYVERAPLCLPRTRVQLLAPLQRPQKIVAIGSNYPRPASTQGSPSPPVLFFKPPSALTGPYDPIRLPAEAATVVGEVELAVVVGKAGHRISPAEAADHVFGYMVANDVTAPEILLGQSALNPLFLQQSRGKGFRSFCPIGPWIETADGLAFPPALTLEQHVDGQLEMRGSTGQMLTGLADLIADVSCAFGLEPGDILLTGSPAPLGGKRTALSPGAVLRSQISGLGLMENPVARETACQGSGA